MIALQDPTQRARIDGDPMLAEARHVQCWSVSVGVDMGEHTGAATIVLPDGRVLSVVVQTAAEAEALAAARIARAGSDLLAADAKPTAHAVADALVAAGLGQG